MAWPLQDKTCIVGIGETEYTRWGRITRASEFQLALEAIVKAVRDAGLEMKDVDGFVTYHGDRNAPISVSQALGVDQLRFANLYPGGGNATCGIVHNAAMAVYSGAANVVVCYRSLCQGQFGRFGQGQSRGGGSGPVAVGGKAAFTNPFGVMAPGQG